MNQPLPPHPIPGMDPRDITRMSLYGGVNIVVSDSVPPPRQPTPGEVGRRIVRHGLADIIRQLPDEGPVGPKPDDPVFQCYVVGGNKLLVHPDAVKYLKSVYI